MEILGLWKIVVRGLNVFSFSERVSWLISVDVLIITVFRFTEPPLPPVL